MFHIICINDLIMTSSADYIKNEDIIKLHSSINNAHRTHACMQDTINVYRYNQLTSQNLLVPKLNSIAVIADLYNFIYRMHIVNYYSIKQFMHAVTLP